MVSRLQIDLAKDLLLQDVPLKEVARRCGFSQQSHFTHRFRMATGTTPARWLRGQWELTGQRADVLLLCAAGSPHTMLVSGERP